MSAKQLRDERAVHHEMLDWVVDMGIVAEYPEVKEALCRASYHANGKPPACPDCGSVLEVVTDGMVGDRPAPFLACSGCEFCVEIQ